MVSNFVVKLVVVCAFATATLAQVSTTGSPVTLSSTVPPSTTSAATSTDVPVATTTTVAPTPPTTTGVATTATTNAPGATPAPTTVITVCDPSCRVNLYFSSFLQTPDNVQTAFSAVAAAAGVVVARVEFNQRPSLYYGLPFGNGTIVTVTISSFPAGVCNNVSNADSCASLVNRSNTPTLDATLAQIGVTNGTLIPPDAAIPTFGIFGTIPSFYLALYVGGGLGYVVFLLWSSYKFLVAYQVMANERTRDEAEKAGLTVEELQEKKREEQEAAKNKGKPKRRPLVPRTPLSAPTVPILDEGITDHFSSTDVDLEQKQSIEAIVTRLRMRTSAQFYEEQERKRQQMAREMVPVVSQQVLDAIHSAMLPPTGGSGEAGSVFSIRRGGLVELQQTLSSMALPENVSKGSFGRDAERGNSQPHDVVNQGNSRVASPRAPLSEVDRAIDSLL